MKTFFITFFLVLLLIVGFVFRMDPAHRWSDAPAPFTRNLLKNEVRISPNNFDERTVKISQMAFISKPDILLLGSSRVRNVGSEFFNPRFSVFNAGVSTASFQDFIGLWEAMKSFKKVPKYVIIFADLWQLNTGANKNATGWQNIRNFVDQFYHRAELAQNSSVTLKSKKNLVDVLESMERNIRHNLELTREILSWPMFYEALREVHKRGFTGDPFSNLVIDRDSLRPENSAIKQDGSFIYPQKESQPKSLEQLTQILESYVKNPNSFDNWLYDEKAAAALAAVVHDILKNRAKVLVILPPFYPSLEKRIDLKNNTIDSFARASSEFAKILNQIPGVDFCDKSLGGSPSCEAQEFMDAIHLRSPCIKKVISSCLSRQRWSDLLRAEFL